MAIELLTFLGLAIVAEGVLLTLFPGALARMMRDMSAIAPDRLRWLGLFAAVAGAALLLALATAAGGSGDAVGSLGFPRVREFLALSF